MIWLNLAFWLAWTACFGWLAYEDWKVIREAKADLLTLPSDAPRLRIVLTATATRYRVLGVTSINSVLVGILAMVVTLMGAPGRGLLLAVTAYAVLSLLALPIGRALAVRSERRARKKATEDWEG